MRVLLVGGAGFIGTRTALRLVREGHVVTVLDSFDPQIHGTDPRASAVCRGLWDAGIRVVQGDARDVEVVRREVELVEAVVYFPACTGTGQSMYEVAHYCDVNVRAAGVFAEILAGCSGSLRRVVVSSTRAVYGEGAATCAEHGRVFPGVRRVEDLRAGRFDTTCPICGGVVEPLASVETDPVSPASIYAITKYAQERVIATAAGTCGVPAIVFRYQNVYGPGQSLNNPYTGILSIFSQLLLAGRGVTLFEGGAPTRDFVHVDDVVEFNARAVVADPAVVGTFNLGSGVRSSLGDLVEAMADVLGSDGPIVRTGQFRVGDIRHALADVGALNRALGTHAFVGLRDGVATFLGWVAGESLDCRANDRFDRSLAEMRERGLLLSGTIPPDAHR